MSDRIPKINELIRSHLGELLTRDLDLKPGIFLTISKVDTTPDLRYARVSVSVFPEKETNYAIKPLKHEAYRLQGKLNKKLAMRPLPRLTFQADMTEAKADVIEKILLEL
jgi:ribosome-binding factor A